MNKGDKIKRHTQVWSVLKGCLWIVDVFLKLKSVKVSWINRISSERISLLIFVDSLCKETYFDYEYLCKTNITKSNDYQIMKYFLYSTRKYLYFLTNVKEIKNNFIWMHYWKNRCGVIKILCTKTSQYFFIIGWGAVLNIWMIL